MSSYFDLKDTIYDITEKHPITIGVFVNNGFSNFEREALRQTLGKSLTLEGALASKKINPAHFCDKLVEAIEANQVTITSGLATAKSENQGEVRIEGILPCPIRIPLLERFNSWLEEHQHTLDYAVDYELKSANLGVSWIKDRLLVEETGDGNALADLFMSAGFDLFFDQKLIGKYKAKGIFQEPTGVKELNTDFDNESIDLKDPQGQYGVIGVVPAIFMVNTQALGDRPMPESWADLLKPEFENSISLPMRDLDLFNAVLLNIYKLYGEEGVHRLGKSLLRSMHPAEMLKSHGNRSTGSIPTITIMPYFFSRMAQGSSPLKGVWPKDGAIVSPIFLLAKKATLEKTRPFVDFFFSKEVGEILSHNGHFPSTHPQVDNYLEPHQKFMWLGWDFINEHNIGELILHTEKLFYEAIGKE